MPRAFRLRELLVLAAGLAAAAALAWAGVTVHDGLKAAGEVAVARLAGVVEDTVVAEWERMLGASAPPVGPAGETFRWKVRGELPYGVNTHFSESDFEEGEPIPPDAESLGDGMWAWPVPVSSEEQAFTTLLEESQRLELVEGDLEGALQLALEASAKVTTDPFDRPQVHLRVLQLAAILDRQDLVAEHWRLLRECEFTGHKGLPFRVLGWLALPPGLQQRWPSSTLATPEELERICLEDDRLTITTDPVHARFELSTLYLLVLERLGLELPPLDRRRARALQVLAEGLPEVDSDARWHPLELAGHPFLARRENDLVTGFFHQPGALELALAERPVRPEGFLLDFEGDEDSRGPAVRPRRPLPGSPFDFTLRHVDPARVANAEASRLRLLRGALFALALGCAGGGFLTARLLARQRKLAELKSSFIAGVSHDLRTPLASILLLAENLESGVAAGADPGRYHRALRKEATRLRRLVDDVLDFSRLERGQAPRLEREELDLARFVAELEEDLGARVREQGRAFACERSGLPVSAALDAHAVRRALENLVDNALKHGTGAVRLAIASEAGRLRLSVADDGPGIPAAELERVFEPFARLASTHVGGVGLGLAIVRSIARAHGGEARVRAGAGDGAGTGTVFELDLPLEEPA